MNSSFSRQVMPKVDVVLVAKCPGWVSTNKTSSQHTPPKKKNGWNLIFGPLESEKHLQTTMFLGYI